MTLNPAKLDRKCKMTTEVKLTAIENPSEYCCPTVHNGRWRDWVLWILLKQATGFGTAVWIWGDSGYRGPMSFIDSLEHGRRRMTKPAFCSIYSRLSLRSGWGWPGSNWSITAVSSCCENSALVLVWEDQSRSASQSPLQIGKSVLVGVCSR
jgi:hypothetical protein